MAYKVGASLSQAKTYLNYAQAKKALEKAAKGSPNTIYIYQSDKLGINWRVVYFRLAGTPIEEKIT